MGVIQMMQSGRVLFYKIGVPEKPKDRVLNLTFVCYRCGTETLAGGTDLLFQVLHLIVAKP